MNAEVDAAVCCRPSVCRNVPPAAKSPSQTPCLISPDYGRTPLRPSRTSITRADTTKRGASAMAVTNQGPASGNSARLSDRSDLITGKLRPQKTVVSRSIRIACLCRGSGGAVIVPPDGRAETERGRRAAPRQEGTSRDLGGAGPETARHQPRQRPLLSDATPAKCRNRQMTGG